MAQHDGVIDNGTGNAVRTDINNALAAINSNNSGGSDPSTTYAYQFYADTGDNTFKIRNAANDGYINISITGGLGTENFGLAPLSGATFTGTVKLNDNIKAIFGTGNDLEIFHDSSDSIINDAGTGNLKLQLGGSTKFEVTSAGATLTGALSVTSTVDGRDIATDGSKLDGIESGATADMTSEEIQDIVGAMFSSNTETGITATYQDADGTIDLVVGTLNQDTTGTAAIATTVTVADESSDTTCFPLFTTAATGNLAPKSGSNLAFNASNGTLTATAFSGDGSNLTGISAGGVGGNQGIDFNDNVAIRFGNSNDVSIDYDSTADRAEIVTSDGASIEIDSDNDLILEADDDITLISGDDFFIKHGTAASNESMISCFSDSSVGLFHNNTQRLTTTSTGVSITGVLENIGVGTRVAVLRDLRAHETNGGTFSSGADRVRLLNSVQHDGESFVTLDTSTGEFTLPAGGYLIYFEALAFDVNNHRAKIVSDGGTDILFGLNARSAAADATMTSSCGFGRVYNSNTEGYFLKHRCASSKSTSGFGQDMNFGTEAEFYARVVIFKME